MPIDLKSLFLGNTSNNQYTADAIQGMIAPCLTEHDGVAVAVVGSSRAGKTTIVDKIRGCPR